MKKVVFIFALLIPIMLLGQQDSAKRTFKIGECKTALIIGKQVYLDQSTVKLTDLVNRAKLKVLGCGDSSVITSFIIAIGINGVFYEMGTNGNTFSDAMITKMKLLENGTYFIIKNVKYSSRNEKECNIMGLVLRVTK